MANLEDDSCLAQLDLLDREIAELSQRDPEIREAQQRVRTAFTVAEALAIMLNRAKVSVSSISKAARIPSETILAILGASSELRVTADLIAKIAAAAGFRFELQFIPASFFDEPKARAEELSEHGVPGGVLMRFPPDGDRRAVHSKLVSGLNRLTDKIYAPKASVGDWSHSVELWELVRFADSADFKLQFRLAPHKSDIEIEAPAQKSANGLNMDFPRGLKRIFGMA